MTSQNEEFEKKIKGWSWNIDAERRKSKEEIMGELDELDRMAEQLTSQELRRRKLLKEEMDQFWRIEEIKARQRARERDIKEGDKNTAYFFFKANQRKRKKCIHSLEQDGVKYEDNDSMTKHAVEFYMKLFEEEPKENLGLDDDFWKEDEKVTKEEDVMLEAEFIEEEIKRAINGSYAKGPQALMDFPLCSIKGFERLLK
jgi:hypothetical protein